jgi:hypothetical protein
MPRALSWCIWIPSTKDVSPTSFISTISSIYNTRKMNFITLMLRYMHYSTVFSTKLKDVTTSSNFKYHYTCMLFFFFFFQSMYACLNASPYVHFFNLVNAFTLSEPFCYQHCFMQLTIFLRIHFSLRLCLVREMTISLRKWITITKNEIWWNEIAIFIP